MPVRGLMVRDSGVVMHGGAVRESSIYMRAQGGKPQKGISQAKTLALNIEQGNAPQNLRGPTNQDASDKRAVLEHFHCMSIERARESLVSLMNAWPPSAVGANFFLFQARQLIVIEEKKGNIIKNVLD